MFGRCSVLVVLVIRPGLGLGDVKADLGRPVQCPRFHLGDEFLPGTVTVESLVRVRCGEGELIKTFLLPGQHPTGEQITT